MISKEFDNNQSMLKVLSEFVIDSTDNQPIFKKSNGFMDVNTELYDTSAKDNRASSNNYTSQTDATISLSFQLIIRAEPTALVLATIRSLIAIKHSNDEIIIIDNNHTQTELYEPLSHYCDALDDALNVHFYHIDAVEGFKAGALNLALGLMDPKCSHIVVVDSDYQALPKARDAIVTAIAAHPDHALLQFPQFYRDAGRADIHSELNHYFNYHLYRAFNRTRALSTGTYAVIRRRALLDMGGWSGASITEDAQMGVLMHRTGLRSRFIPNVIATGLLPNTFCDLIGQRQRWIYGNAQVLNTYFTAPTLQKPTHERLSYLRAHLSQLSAWINFTGVFILLHICTLLVISALLLTNISANIAALLTPLYVVYAAYGVFLLRRLWAYLQDSSPLNKQVNKHYAPTLSKKLRAWALHLNFWEIGALSWLPVLWGRDKPFVCTPKQDIARTKQTVLGDNIRALPKLIIMLNIVTLALVSPLSVLYSPVLFVSALIIIAIKLWSAKVAFDNYAYSDVSKPLTMSSTVPAKASSHVNNSISATFNSKKLQDS
ncbi:MULTISPECIES: glycosyltransferase family 2 protein [unclassified Psychrobacter]|uniref:glycosyltransferase family 2 protein n=1 Tax=unclassified Psychrobacter TaxID=196806 RepID=UPI003FD00478